MQSELRMAIMAKIALILSSTYPKTFPLLLTHDAVQKTTRGSLRALVKAKAYEDMGRGAQQVMEQMLADAESAVRAEKLEVDMALGEWLSIGLYVEEPEDFQSGETRYPKGVYGGVLWAHPEDPEKQILAAQSPTWAKAAPMEGKWIQVQDAIKDLALVETGKLTKFKKYWTELRVAIDAGLHPTDRKTFWIRFWETYQDSYRRYQNNEFVDLDALEIKVYDSEVAGFQMVELDIGKPFVSRSEDEFLQGFGQMKCYDWCEFGLYAVGRYCQDRNLRVISSFSHIALIKVMVQPCSHTGENKEDGKTLSHIAAAVHNRIAAEQEVVINMTR